jgi:large subunit ribosomal protein L10
MAIAREAKEQQLAAIRKHFDDAVAAVFVDFRGIDVETITDLRTRFRDAGVEYRVVKNNLVRKAFEGTALEGNEAIEGQLVGCTAVAWSFEDPSAAAKIIKAFRKEGDKQEKLQVKLGLLQEQVLDASRVESELASLPGKDEIRAQLLAQLMAPAQSLVRQIQAPSQNLAYALDARKRQQEETG